MEAESAPAGNQHDRNDSNYTRRHEVGDPEPVVSRKERCADGAAGPQVDRHIEVCSFISGDAVGKVGRIRT
jgi:hypothetical protein